MEEDKKKQLQQHPKLRIESKLIYIVKKHDANA